jgi:hypothetical protein
VTLDTAHRLGVGLNLHQPHCGPARHALHHAPPKLRAHMEGIGLPCCQAVAADCVRGVAGGPRRPGAVGGA